MISSLAMFECPMEISFTITHGWCCQWYIVNLQSRTMLHPEVTPVEIKVVNKIVVIQALCQLLCVYNMYKMFWVEKTTEHPVTLKGDTLKKKRLVETKTKRREEGNNHLWSLVSSGYFSWRVPVCQWQLASWAPAEKCQGGSTVEQLKGQEGFNLHKNIVVDLLFEEAFQQGTHKKLHWGNKSHLRRC